MAYCQTAYPGSRGAVEIELATQASGARSPTGGGQGSLFEAVKAHTEAVRANTRTVEQVTHTTSSWS